MNDSNIQISIVIPTYKTIDSLNEIFHKLFLYKQYIYEIIIIDSSDDNTISDFIKNKQSSLIKYNKIERAYPGKARNYGINISKCKWIAFLDSKTIPDDQWLKYLHSKIKENYELILGSIKYRAYTNFQKNLKAASFGNINHECVPGTAIKKNLLIKENLFQERVLAGEDIYWRENLKKSNIKIDSPNFNTVTYNNLSKNIFSTLKKYFLYSYHASNINVFNNIKEFYLVLTLILSVLIIPKWNRLISGWDDNPLYIPHITKIYLVSFIIFLLLVLIFKKYLVDKFKFKFFFFNFLKYFSIILFFIVAFTWNANIAHWIEDDIWYFPHITKIYLFFLIIISIISRGIILPIYRKEKLIFLFPLRWIIVGTIGLLLDIIKAPAYILGAIKIPFNYLYELYLSSK